MAAETDTTHFGQNYVKYSKISRWERKTKSLKFQFLRARFPSPRDPLLSHTHHLGALLIFFFFLNDKNNLKRLSTKIRTIQLSVSIMQHHKWFSLLTSSPTSQTTKRGQEKARVLTATNG